jgi:hypothetical protein
LDSSAEPSIEIVHQFARHDCVLHASGNSGHEAFLKIGENTESSLLVYRQLNEAGIHGHEQPVYARRNSDWSPTRREVGITLLKDETCSGDFPSVGDIAIPDAFPENSAEEFDHRDFTEFQEQVTDFVHTRG